MMGTMINAASPLRSVAAAGTPAEQLTLLPNTDVTPRFRLSQATRERGLRHVAEIRQMLAERAEASSTVSDPLTVRHDRAA